VTAELLYQNGFKAAEELAASDEETVGDIEGIGPERAGGILTAAREHVARKREEEALAAATAATAAAAAAEAETTGDEEGGTPGTHVPEETQG
jgi:hypothetical protein